MSGNRAKKTPNRIAPKATATNSEKANTLTVQSDGKKGMPRIKAELALTSELLNASTARKYVASVAGELDFTELVAVMHEKTDQVKAGDLSGLEATLTAQAVLLDGIFNEMARRASLNMKEHLQAMDVYMRLALKAQSQCRTTVEALAEIKNPRPVAFVRQANISHGPQQVNNGIPSHAREIENQQSKLSGAVNELPSNTGTSALAGSVNQGMEAVGAINGAEVKNG